MGSQHTPETRRRTFWERVTIADGCWLWTGTTDTFGYGVLYFGTREDSHQTAAHRYLWEMLWGPIPEGQYVLHGCDTPACVNPNHLRLGTKKENTADMLARGRNRNGSHRASRSIGLLDPKCKH